MNIVFLHTVAIDPLKGGIEKVTHILGTALRERGHSVDYISMMDVYKESCDKSYQYFFPNKKIYAKENQFFLRNFFQEKKTDLVIFQAGDDKRIPFPHLFSSLGIRLIVAVHTDPEFYKAHVKNKIASKYGDAAVQSPFLQFLTKIKIFIRRQKQRKIYRKNSSIAEKVILLSPKFEPRFKTYLKKRDRGKICSIPNPVENIPHRLPKEKGHEILYVGRMNIDEKRVSHLLRIWKLIQHEFPDWNLRLVGGGSDEKELKELSKKLKLLRVSFEGFQKPQKYYERASIFCLTSAFEGFGLVLVEASAFGCVPVAFNSYPSAEEIIQSESNGFLVPENDIHAYADVLRQLMSNQELREKLSFEANKNAQRFSLEKILPKWEQVLEF